MTKWCRLCAIEGNCCLMAYNYPPKVSKKTMISPSTQQRVMQENKQFKEFKWIMSMENKTYGRIICLNTKVLLWFRK